MGVPAIVTERLELVSMGVAFLEPLLEGRRSDAESAGGFAVPRDFPDEHDRRFLELRLRQMREDPASQEWLVRAMVLREGPRPGRMVGHIGFHEPPQEGTAEMGYTVFPEYRRRGYAQEGTEGLMRWAGTERGVRRYRLSISPENGPSLALAAKLGFERTGEQMDPEDGLEWVFEREYAPPAEGGWSQSRG